MRPKFESLDWDLVLVYAGYIQPERDMQKWLKWIYYLSPSAWAFDGLMMNEFARIKVSRIPSLAISTMTEFDSVPLCGIIDRASERCRRWTRRSLSVCVQGALAIILCSHPRPPQVRTRPESSLYRVWCSFGRSHDPWYRLFGCGFRHGAIPPVAKELPNSGIPLCVLPDHAGSGHGIRLC